MSASNPPNWRRDWAVAIGVLLGATLLCWLTPIDLKLQAYFYHPQLGFEKPDTPFWHFIYHYGIFVGYAVAIAALVVISLSYWQIRFYPYRRQALMLVLVVFIGPGLLVNLTFKDHWGRPRPREVVQFGGTEPFVPVGWIGPSGKSFPCGHCSMGFFLAVPYLFWRGRNKLWAATSLVVGIGYGVLLGLARVRLGAHFPSDVLWSGGIIWLTALGLYYGLKVYLPMPPRPQHSLRQARRVTWGVGIALPVLTVGLLLATPYISHKEFSLANAQLKALPVKALHLQLQAANVSLGVDSALSINYQVNAFGFPNSKLRYEWFPGADTALYAIYTAGWFTEVRNKVQVLLPANLALPVLVQVSQGKVTLSTQLLAATGNYTIEVADGEIVLQLPPQPNLALQYQSPAVQTSLPLNLPAGKGQALLGAAPRLQLTLVVKKGTLVLR